MKCTFCKKEIQGYGHNADPFKGQCCNKCHSKVILKRIEDLQ